MAGTPKIEAQVQLRIPIPNINSFVFKNPQISCILSALLLVAAHRITSSATLTDPGFLVLMWSGSLGFALLALPKDRFDITNLGFFTTGLHLIFMTRLYTPEWEHVTVDIWMTSSILITAFPVSSFIGGWSTQKAQAVAFITSACLFTFTDACTAGIPSNSWLRIFMWTMWLCYTTAALAITNVHLETCIPPFALLYVVSVFALLTRSSAARDISMGLWPLVWVSVFLFSPFLESTIVTVKMRDVAAISSGLLFVWVHVYCTAILPSLRTSGCTEWESFAALFLLVIWWILSVAMITPGPDTSCRTTNYVICSLFMLCVAVVIFWILCFGDAHELCFSVGCIVLALLLTMLHHDPDRFGP